MDKISKNINIILKFSGLNYREKIYFKLFLFFKKI